MSTTGTAAGCEPDHDRQRRFYHDVFEFHIDVATRLVLVKFGTKIGADDVAGYATELRSHAAFQPTFSEIVDLREAEDLDLQGSDFLRLADKVDPFSEHSKRAFVVRTRVQNHAARMHKALGGHGTIAILESLEDAEAWIGS